MADPIELTTFKSPDDWCFRELREATVPAVFNGHVSVVRYRVTVEAIDEPEEVEARLRKLWSENRNSHHYGPLREEAKRHGVELGRRS